MGGGVCACVFECVCAIIFMVKYVMYLLKKR